MRKTLRRILIDLFYTKDVSYIIRHTHWCRTLTVVITKLRKMCGWVWKLFPYNLTKMKPKLHRWKHLSVKQKISFSFFFYTHCILKQRWRKLKKTIRCLSCIECHTQLNGFYESVAVTMYGGRVTSGSSPAPRTVAF